MRDVAHGIRARGETPFLHAAGFNTPAIRLYEHLGFVLRSEIAFAVFHTPPAGGHLLGPDTSRATSSAQPQDRVIPAPPWP